MARQYRYGASRERALKKMLEKRGWFVVRAAGSKGAVDLLAVKDGKCVGIQVKSGTARPTSEEKKQLSDLTKFGMETIIALWDKQKRKWKFLTPDGREVVLGDGGCQSTLTKKQE